MSIALITGGTRGIGLATARALAADGHTVLITGRHTEAVVAVSDAAAGEGLALDGITLDVTDAASIAAAVERVRATYGRLDVLVNNAGILPEATDPEPHEYASVDLFRSTFETNVFGVVGVTEAFLPLLRATPGSRVVNVSSTMGSLDAQSDPESPWYPMVVPAYQTSKAALNSITIQLAKKLADAGSDIVVLAICPGWVQTDLAPGNREQAPLTAQEAATIVADAATGTLDAPSGSFIDAAGLVRW